MSDFQLLLSAALLSSTILQTSVMPTPGHSKGKLHANTRAIKGQVNLTQHTPVVYIVQYNILIMYVWVQMVEVMYTGPNSSHIHWMMVISGNAICPGVQYSEVVMLC